MGDDSGVTGVTDTIIVDVGRPAGDVTVAWLAALCEVLVTDEGTGTTENEERATTGGGREVITGGTGGRREVTMGGSKVVIGVSDDAGGITGGSPSVVAEIGGLVTTGVTDGTTTGEAVGGDMSDDADGTPVPNRNELDDATGVQDEVVLGLVQGVLMLESNVDDDGLDGVAVASVLVNGIADVAVELSQGQKNIRTDNMCLLSEAETI